MPGRVLRTLRPPDELPALELVLAPGVPNEGIGERGLRDPDADVGGLSILPLRLEVDPPGGIRVAEDKLLVVTDERVGAGEGATFFGANPKVGLDTGIPGPFDLVVPAPLFHTL